MIKTILVTGAGGGGSSNLIEGIRRGRFDVRIIGTNCDPFACYKSTAERTYLLPVATEPDYQGKLTKVLEREHVDLLVPNSDREVRAVSKFRDELPCRTFLPSHETVLLCQDKYDFYLRAAELGLAMAETYPVASLASVDEIFEKFAGQEKLWIRMRKGAGSMGATSIATKEHAIWWLKYWEEMRDVPPSMFIISEYLPGRDFAFRSVWKNGKLLIGKLCERLTYVGGANRVSGVSSSPSVGRLIREPAVLDFCVETVERMAPGAQGNFNIDIKCDRDGNPNICEINIGRFFMILPIFDWTGNCNPSEIYLRAAFGEEVIVPDPLGDFPEEEIYLIRELDTLPSVAPMSEIRRKILTV